MMRRLLPLLAMLVLWEGLCLAKVLPDFVLPSPLAVALRLWADAPLLAGHAAATVIEVALGLMLGVGMGGLLAVAMQLSARLRRLVAPMLALSQAVPVFVLAPVLTLWLGYGLGPKIAMTVLLVFFPVTTSLLESMATVPQASLDLARIAGANPWRSLLWLQLPHAVPGLRAGLKIAATYAPTGAVIGEWIGASQGLGFLMLKANAMMQADLMFAALVLVVAITLALVWLVEALPAEADQTFRPAKSAGPAARFP